MNSVGITGGRGFIGTNLISYFKEKNPNTVKIIKFNNDVTKKNKVDKFVEKCDIVIHLAGKNKAEDKEILDVNISGTLNVTNACYSHKKGLICVGSRYLKQDAYLISRNVSEAILSEYCKLGLQGLLIKLDKVFGPGCKPFYNSFATTLIYLISKNQPYRHLIKNENELLELLYIEDVCKWIHSFSDSFLNNGAFYTNKFEFWDPIKITIKDLVNVLETHIVDVSVEHQEKIMKTLEWYKNNNEIFQTH